VNTITTPGGEEMVLLSREEYEDLIDARDSALAMRDPETFSEAEVDEYLAAPSPLAFYRKQRGLTQTALAEAAETSQAYLAQLEARKRVGSVEVLAKLARVLRVQIDDLVPDAA
jgi:DNA-binding XRE family transcriptional regulator